MKRHHGIAVALILAGATILPTALRADVRSEEKTRVEFGGMLGRMMNMFGGKAAREGVTSTIAVKGDRLARLSENDGQIIDLAEEKIYDLDLRKKSYKVTTFAELRRRMEEARKKAEEDARKAEATKSEKPAAADQKEPQVEVDFNIKNTGERKSLNGFDTQQQVMTITVREKGKTLEQSGGLVMTADMWMAPKIAAMKEVQDFYIRYAKKLYGGTMLAGVQAEQMAMLTAMYPMMKDAIGKMNAEGERVQGTPILTTMTFEGVKSEAQVAQEAQDAKTGGDDSSKTPTSVGGLLGGFAKRAAAKKAASNDASADKSRSKVFTSTTEVLKVVTDVSAADVAVPSGFKENK